MCACRGEGGQTAVSCAVCCRRWQLLQDGKAGCSARLVAERRDGQPPDSAGSHDGMCRHSTVCCCTHSSAKPVNSQCKHLAWQIQLNTELYAKTACRIVPLINTKRALRLKITLAGTLQAHAGW